MRTLAAASVLALLSFGGCRDAPGPDPTGPAITATTLGRIYLQEGRLPEAEEKFREVIRLIPRAGSGYANLAQVMLRAGRYRDAARQLDKAIARDTGNVEYRLLRARAWARSGRLDAARRELEARVSAADGRVPYALAALATTAQDSAAWLRRAVDASPANVTARLDLALALTRAGLADSALGELEELRRTWAEPPAEAMVPFAEAIRRLQSGDATGALPELARFQRIYELTVGFQSARLAIAGIGGPVAGYPVLTLSPLQTDSTAPVALAFRLDTLESNAVLALASGDLDGDGIDELLLGGRMLAPGGRGVVAIPGMGGVATAGVVSAVAVADLDNDGHQDLFLADDRGGHLWRGTGNGGMTDARVAGLAAERSVRDALFIDFDTDGDLDLLLATSDGLRAWRNNLDGTMTEVGAATGLAGPAAGIDFTEYDGDGRLDIVVAGGEGAPRRLLRNLGQQRFADRADSAGLPAGATVLATGDYDNDGLLDLFVGGPERSGTWRNMGDGTFARDARAGAGLDALAAAPPARAAWVDLDNDGRLDLIASTGASLLLYRNEGDGRFTDRSSALPALPGEIGAMLVADPDRDGDEDVLLAGSAGAWMLRNANGNARAWATIELTALRTGSGKNNSFGIGARLELRAGELLQTRLVRGRQTHFGLGAHRGADALRIEWPNGVPQVLASGVSSEVREADILKGSCAFVYGWNGARFELLTDVMWKSALGMPLGIMGSNTTYGPPGASTEYVRIPGDALAPRDGRYVLQFTEELWETAYLDQARLLVVDHPDSVDLFVNERFVPPGPTPLVTYQAARARPPVAASNGEGADLLPALRSRDDRYVSRLTPGRYQGITTPSELILDLGGLEGIRRPHLFLNGWIFPSDASINLAAGQAKNAAAAAPVLEVPDGRGGWRIAVADLGFPAGKRKTIVADLTGAFSGPDHRIRIRTNMQLYWDQAFVADVATGELAITALEPVSADLHYRGFSRTFRKGGRYGPQWFDYGDVSRENPWRPITGRFTRYGDVSAYLTEADDRYVIMAPGDEATVAFDANRAPPLRTGWRRTFLLYTNGWIKDSDLNTATGTEVEPFPFHAMREYPYGRGAPIPQGFQPFADSIHTRAVSRHR